MTFQMSDFHDKYFNLKKKAQGLKEIITSCRKLNLNDNHRIYLMKDETDNKYYISFF